MAEESQGLFTKHCEAEDDDLAFEHDFRARASGHGQLRRASRAPSLTTWMLLAVVVVQTAYIFWSQRHAGAQLSTIGQPLLPSKEYIANAPSVFTSANESEAGAAWARIASGHGDVALDADWARAHSLPATAEHPYMPGKRLYIVSAYHAIHCIKVIRNHYFAMLAPSADSPETGTWDVQHDKHCFNVLRQQVMCAADDSLMVTQGHNDVGYRQPKRCRDWSALRDWAAAHSACWHDHINPRPEGERWWNQCDGGHDGLPEGGL